MDKDVKICIIYVITQDKNSLLIKKFRELFPYYHIKPVIVINKKNKDSLALHNLCWKDFIDNSHDRKENISMIISENISIEENVENNMDKLKYLLNLNEKESEEEFPEVLVVGYDKNQTKKESRSKILQSSLSILTNKSVEANFGWEKDEDLDFVLPDFFSNPTCYLITVEGATKMLNLYNDVYEKLSTFTTFSTFLNTSRFFGNINARVYKESFFALKPGNVSDDAFFPLFPSLVAGKFKLWDSYVKNIISQPIFSFRRCQITYASLLLITFAILCGQFNISFQFFFKSILVMFSIDVLNGRLADILLHVILMSLFYVYGKHAMTIEFLKKLLIIHSLKN